MLDQKFFNRDAIEVAIELLGTVLTHYVNGIALRSRIIETESYFLHENGSHASLGFTEKRKALFMPPGTIYMYYARGGDSFNVSCKGKGNAVLIKSGVPLVEEDIPEAIKLMLRLNPQKNGKARKTNKLCSGQTLICKSLGIKVKEYDQRAFRKGKIEITESSNKCAEYIVTTRLGIPLGRDEHLWQRFIDKPYSKFCTSNPLSKRYWEEGIQFKTIN